MTNVWNYEYHLKYIIHNQHDYTGHVYKILEVDK